MVYVMYLLYLVDSQRVIVCKDSRANVVKQTLMNA